MISFALLIVLILVGIFWITRHEEHVNRFRPLLKIEDIWSGKERRREKRLPCTIPVLYSTPVSSGSKRTKVKNMSGGGMQLVLLEKLEKGTELELEFSFTEKQRPFRVVAEVVWRQETSPEGTQRLFRTGLRFIWEKEAQRLRQYLYGKGAH